MLISKDLGVVIIILHTLKNIKHIFLVVSLVTLFVLMIDSANQLFVAEE